MMDPVYKKRTRDTLVKFHLIFPVVAIGILGVISPYFILVFPYFCIPVAIILLSLLGITIISLQDRHVNYGYLIFINLAVEVSTWIWFLKLILDSLLKNPRYGDGWQYVSLLIILILSIFAHVFIASTLFSKASARRFAASVIITIVFVVLVGGGMIASAINSLNPSDWKTFTNADCEYEITYSPVLTMYGYSDPLSGDPCFHWVFDGNGRGKVEISRYANNSPSI